jgi:uncharacterized peroxidase-related enzyme
MSRLDLEFNPTPEANDILDNIKKKIGRVPNIYKLLAHAPNVLSGYIQFSTSLDHGTLAPKEIQQIALIVAGYDRCEYCASAHSLMARHAGVDNEEITKNLKGQSNDNRTATLIKFCRGILQNKGVVGDDVYNELLKAGFTEAQVVEIVGNIAANIFTNYFNNLIGTELDFPKVNLD